MNLVVYADESGTHGDNGKPQGNEFALIACWIAYSNVWDSFSVEWKSILEKKKVSHFHFSQFALASAKARNPEKVVPSNFAKNQFRHLSATELDELYDSLATLLFNPEIGFECSVFDHKQYLAERDKITHEVAKLFKNDPLNYLIHSFFKKTLQRIFARWGENQAIEFVFDDVQEKEWQSRIHIVVEAYKSFGVQIASLSFKNQHKAIPIQAADMAAYRNNQVARNARAGKTKDPRTLNVFDRVMFERVKRDLERFKANAPFVKSFNIPSHQ